MTKTPRERFEQMKLQDDITFLTHKMSAKLGDVAIDDMWECVWSHVSALLEEARQQGREEMKKEFIKFVKEETSFPKIRLLDRKDLLNFLSL